MANKITIDALTTGGAANHVLYDTEANIQLFTNTSGAFTGGVIAISSDTGKVFWDADRNFSAGSLTLGTFTSQSLTNSNVSFIA